MREIAARLDREDQIVINWGLVMLWARFEVLLERLLLTMFRAKPETLVGWAGKMSVTVGELQEATDIAAVIDAVHERVIRHFTAESIERRVKILKQRLNLRDEHLFSLRWGDVYDNPPDIDLSLKSIRHISDRRNAIVHNERLPLVTYEEFDNASYLLSLFLMNLGEVVGEKASIPVLFGGKPISEMR